jgi:hypothetical protein
MTSDKKKIACNGSNFKVYKYKITISVKCSTIPTDLCSYLILPSMDPTTIEPSPVEAKHWKFVPLANW